MMPSLRGARRRNGQHTQMSPLDLIRRFISGGKSLGGKSWIAAGALGVA
jgi:hypothetical protein